jgi:mono/diheme cytochrome c family protein
MIVTRSQLRTLLLSFSALLATTASVARADGDVAAGKKVFAANCVLCHGTKGKGDGQAAATLNPKPKDFTDTKAMAKITPEIRLKAVTEGGAAAGVSPVMPAFGQMLSPKQIEDVLAYVATFSK